MIDAGGAQGSAGSCRDEKVRVQRLFGNGCTVVIEEAGDASMLCVAVFG